MTDIEQARRGRTPQSGTEARRDRRMKEGQTETEGLKLPIPDWVSEKFPASEYEFYWFRDTQGRLYAAHKRDWDPLDGVEPVPGAADEHGRPVNHVLHIKFKDWVLADRDKREGARKQIEGQMKRGEVAAGKGDDATGATLSRDISYASESNTL